MNWPATGEIDIVECYGTDQSCSYHYHYSGGGPGGNSTVVGSTTGFHTYATNWEPNKITWYYDGIQVWQTSVGVISVPQFLIVNLGLNGKAGSVPATMQIDYVRVWNKGQNTLPTAEPNFNTADQEPDGDVDYIDFNTLAFNFGLSGVAGWIRSDIIKDGAVNIFDFNKLISNIGK